MMRFAWDTHKEIENIWKHGVDFKTAEKAFEDPCRVIFFDPTHSKAEKRFLCFGRVEHKILTVRFTYRGNAIRIIGAGYWRKGRRIYEKRKKESK